jgi:hypothetical protein
MTEQDTQACCAHLVIHYRTEPAEHGTVRGYWACATCQRRTSDPFARIPEQDEPGAVQYLRDQSRYRGNATLPMRGVCAATGQRPTDEARTACEVVAYIDALKSQPPTDGLRERVEAVIYDIEGTFEAALATPSPAMRALLDRLRAALAATQPEASDAEVGS